jgi:pimeloyl-ACP methyl ester carboxylesterase
VQDEQHAPRGVLLFLTGGPGEAGVAFVSRVESHLARAFAGYRLVMIDQRGTGAGALDCPALQRAVGASDLTVPPAGAIPACARRIGQARRYFTTPETVADLELLRAALGVRRLTLDGVSYGTFTAERYALTYPDRVARMVLDSVVPQQGLDPLYRASLTATARVLRAVCEQQKCGWDPARDVAAVVRKQHDGPQVLDALVTESIGAPSFPGVVALLHAAAHGHLQGLTRLIKAAHLADAVPAMLLSQGLHESTLCLDLGAGWHPAAPSADRARTLRELADATPVRDLFPFDRATAIGNGLAQSCLQWPATRPPAIQQPSASADLPAVPILLLAGARDLSTPLAWARAEALKTPHGRLVVVPDAGHSVQLRATNPIGREEVARFLHSAP